MTTAEHEFLVPNLEAIPSELRALACWVTWRAEGIAGEKPRKVPYSPTLPNARASCSDPHTWGTFAQAEAAYSEGDRTGIGIVLDGTTRLAGIDIDHCRDAETGSIDSRALELLDSLNARYVEVSPSGTGLRAFGRADGLERGCKGKFNGLDVELYTSGRYLTVTGQTVRAGAIGPLHGFSELAQVIRSNRQRLDTRTGEVLSSTADERYGELTRRILTGAVFHDSLRDLAAAMVAAGMASGAVVQHLRGIMDAAQVPHDARWQARRNQIPELVRTAETKYRQPLTLEEHPEPKGAAPHFNLAELTAARLFNGSPPQQQWLVEEIFPLGKVCVLASAPGIGKSFLALELARAVSTSNVANTAFCFGAKVQAQGRAVYISAEDDLSELHRRLFSLCDGLMPDKLHVLSLPDVGHFGIITQDRQTKNFITTALWRSLSDEIRALDEVKLVVLDTLQALTTGDTNTAEAVQPLMNEAAALGAATGATVLLIHHVGKGSTRDIKSALDAAEAVRGSGAIVGSARAVYTLWMPTDGGKAACKELGEPYEEGAIVLGMVAKSNGAARRDTTVFLRDKRGLLVDVSMRHAALAGASDDAMRAKLAQIIVDGWKAGEPYSAAAGSPRGLHALRHSLPAAYHDKKRAWFNEQVAELVERKQIARVKCKGGAMLAPPGADKLDAP